MILLLADNMFLSSVLLSFNIPYHLGECGMKRFIWAIFLLAAAFLVSSAWAEPTPSTINYQSYLTDESGDPLPDGNYDITFRIFNVPADGSALWTEIRTGENSVPITSGHFSVDLGSITTFESAGLDFSEQYYLEIQIGSDDPFSPRLGFAAVPYAMHAKNMDGTPLPEGDIVGTSDVQTLTDKTLTSPVITGGSIDNAVIGASTPAEGTFTTMTATGNLSVAGTILGKTVIASTPKMADYTLTDTDDIILVNTIVGALTVTLPTAVGNDGRAFTIKLTTAGNPLTIAADGLETIDNDSTLTLEVQGQAVRLVSDGSNWHAVAEVGSVVRKHDTSDLDGGQTVAGGDEIVLNDMIVAGSQCVGLDCANGEGFDFDTLKLKENNLRIHFQDTSAALQFPTNDWRIAINDTTVGGRSYFAIQDVDNGINGLVVEAGGNVGLGTTGAPQGRLDVQTVYSGATGTISTAFTGSGTLTVAEDPGIGTITTSGTSVTGTGTLFSIYLRAGQQLQAAEQVRTITSITSNTSLTVDSAWSSDLTAASFTTPGSQLVGTGTLFETELSIGDYIYIGGSFRMITSFTGDTILDIDTSWDSFFSDESFIYTGTKVVGTGTSFLGELAPGDIIFVAGISRQISTIQTDELLSVTSAYNSIITGDLPFAYTNSQAQPKTGFIVTVDGKVGIGTATPDEMFEIEFAPGVDVEIGRGTIDPDVTFIALRSPDGTKYYITVNDLGDLVASTDKP
jgi:hypothetical protein